MMAQSWAESTRDTYNYGQYIDQFPPNTIKAIRQYERIQKKICRQKISIIFNEICIYIYIYICVCVYIYIYIYIYIIINIWRDIFTWIMCITVQYWSYSSVDINWPEAEP